MEKLREKDIIEKIIYIEISILEIYQKLNKLELDNKKESLEYKELLSLQQEAIKIEDKYFNELDIESIAKTQNIYSTDPFKYAIKKLTKVTSNIEDNLLYNRIINYISYLSIEDYILDGSKNPPDVYDYIISELGSLEERSSYLTILNNYIKNSNSKREKKLLLDEKYYELFKDKKLDDYLLLETKKNMRNYMFNIGYNKALVNKIYDMQIQEMLVNEITGMLQVITDESLKVGTYYKNEQLISSIYLESILELLDNKDMFDRVYYNIYKNIFSDPDYQKHMENSTVSTSVIKNILNKEMEKYSNKDINAKEKIKVKENS